MHSHTQRRDIVEDLHTSQTPHISYECTSSYALSLRITVKGDTEALDSRGKAPPIVHDVCTTLPKYVQRSRPVYTAHPTFKQLARATSA